MLDILNQARYRKNNARKVLSLMSQISKSPKKVSQKKIRKETKRLNKIMRKNPKPLQDWIKDTNQNKKPDLKKLFVSALREAKEQA
jgi:hypothetical protein